MVPDQQRTAYALRSIRDKTLSFETHRCAMLLRVRGGTVGTHFKRPRLQAAMIFFAAWVRKPDRV